MAIPAFHQITLPLLRLVGSREQMGLPECYSILGKEFKLTDAELSELLPSGKKRRFYDRVQWASTYLRQTKLLESPKRGVFRITDRGRQTLAESPTAIDLKYLSRFPELEEFLNRKRETAPTHNGDVSAGEMSTPEEQLEAIHQSLRDALADDILERVKRCTPTFFERLVVEVLVAMGYGGSLKDAGQAIGRSGDGGIDGIIKEDRLGLDNLYVQAKRWENPVGRPIVQGFTGSLEGHRARKGVMMTTSHFTEDAKEYVNRIEKRVVLVDGKTLARLMIEHGVGVTTAATFEIKKIDSDYFDEE